jgi:hypothetical protein
MLSLCDTTAACPTLPMSCLHNTTAACLTLPMACLHNTTAACLTFFLQRRPIRRVIRHFDVTSSVGSSPASQICSRQPLTHAVELNLLDIGVEHLQKNDF